jgi:hypothetical protein
MKRPKQAALHAERRLPLWAIQKTQECGCRRQWFHPIQTGPVVLAMVLDFVHGSGFLVSRPDRNGRGSIRPWFDRLTANGSCSP